MLWAPRSLTWAQSAALHTYLTERQIPALSPPAPARRRLVYQRAIALLRSDNRTMSWLPTILCVAGGVTGSLVGAYLFSYLGLGQSPIAGEKGMESIAWSYSSVAIGSLTAGFIGLQLQRRRLRP